MTEVDSGVDSGTRDSGMTMDTGMPPEDSGTDAGTDAGPPPAEAFVRLAHLSPNTGDVVACIDLRFGDTRVGGLGPLPEGGIPFRGISPYLALEIAEGATYRVKIFPVMEGVTVNCMNDSPLSLDVPAADLEADAYYTGAAIGYSEEEGSLPSVCPSSTMPPTFDQPCPEALAVRLALFEDDATLDADAAKIRVLHAIPNAPAVDVCYDDDPEDETAPVTIASNVAFGTASAYFSSPAEINSGVLTVHAHVDGASCVAAATLAPLPLPDTFNAIRANEAFAEVLPFLPTSFALNNIYTVFAQGSMPLPVTMNPEGVLFLPWQDAPPPAEE